MKENIVLVGAGGHARSCIDVIETEGRFQIAALVDTKERKGQKVLGYIISASDDDLKKILKQHKNFLIALGQVKGAVKRKELYEEIRERGGRFPFIVAPTATVSKNAEIGEGTIVMHGAKINAGAIIGNNCIINTGAIIEHDVVISDHCHVATGAVVNGGCQIGQASLIGSNSVLVPGIKLATGAVVGAGAVILKDISDAGTYVGNPARKLKRS